MLRGHIPGEFGRVVMTIAVLAAALIAVAVAWLIGSAVRGQRIEHRGATHAALQH